MHVQVPSILPDSRLNPRQVLQKFSPQSLAGLGRGPFPGFSGLGQCGGCAEYDDDGNCITLEPDCGTTDTGTTTLPLPIACANGLVLNPDGSGTCIAPTTTTTVAPGVTPGTTTVSGSTTSSLCGSSNPSDQALCSLLNTGTGSAVNTPASTGLTNAQIASIASQLASGASQAAILSQLPAGYSIKNGAIIPPSTSLIAGVSNTTLLMGAGIAVFALILISSGKRK